MGLNDDYYVYDPSLDPEMVGECDLCSRPVREDEYLIENGRRVCWNGEEGCASEATVEADAMRRYEAAGRMLESLRAEAASRAYTGPVCPAIGCSFRGPQEECPDHGIGAHYRRAAAEGVSSGD